MRLELNRFIFNAFYLLAALVLLIVASQLTRFENEITVSYNGTNLTAKTQQSMFAIPLQQANFSRIEAYFQKSMNGETDLNYLEILDGNGKTVFLSKKFSIYIFGKNFFGATQKKELAYFKKTFGDWSMDSFKSKALVLYNESLPSNFIVRASFVGRGETSFDFLGDRRITVTKRDGLMNNDFYLCLNYICQVATGEGVFTNVKRIINFFIEATALGLLIGLLVLTASQIYHLLYVKTGKIKGHKVELTKQGRSLNLYFWAFIFSLALCHFLLASYMSIHILGSTPHTPDSAAYYREGVLLSQGKLFIRNFANAHEPFEAFLFMWSGVRNGNFYFNYNHFWPALLAIPIKLGVPQFLNPLLSSISLIFIYLLTSSIYDRKTGCIAALLYCVSPFIIIMSGEYMLHTPTQLFLLAALYCMFAYVKEPRIAYAILSGFLLAYAFGLRQLTTLAFIFPIFIYFIIVHHKKILRIKSLWFLVGVLPVCAFFLIDNQIITGDYLHVAHPATTSAISINNIKTGIDLMDSNLGFLPSIAFHGLFPMLLISIAFIPLIFLRKKEDFLFISIFISLLSTYCLYNFIGLHGYGPRFLFEAVFIFFILGARGINWVLEINHGFVKILFAVLFLGLIVNNVIGLYNILPYYKDYNHINTDFLEKLRHMDLKNSIIVSKPEGWWDLGISATLYDPNYEKSFFIKELPNNAHHRILCGNTNRKIYRISGTNVLPYDAPLDCSQYTQTEQYKGDQTI